MHVRVCKMNYYISYVPFNAHNACGIILIRLSNVKRGQTKLVSVKSNATIIYNIKKNHIRI